jgi:hypothetical protein
LISTSLRHQDPRGPVTARGLLEALRFVLLVLLGLAAFLWILAQLQTHAGLDFAAGYWAGTGILFLILTLRRPWWFWDHPKARFVRDIIGDRGTTVLYVGIALTLLGVSAYRQVAIVRARRSCAAALAAAKDVHERMRVLYGPGVSGLPRVDKSSSTAFTCERLLNRN